jgi:four helix bundle protein
MGYYRDLEAWKEAHQLVLAVYRLSGSFPRDERFGLTAQVRRAVVSVTSNLAEGAGRRTDPYLLTFVGYAMGSLQEVDAQLLIAKDLGFAPPASFEEVEARLGTVGRLIAGLRSSLERSLDRGPKRPPRPDPRPPSDH